MLALHLPQNCMVHVNTLMVQRVLGEPISGYVNPYGTFRLDMTARLPLDLPPRKPLRINS